MTVPVPPPPPPARSGRWVWVALGVAVAAALALVALGLLGWARLAGPSPAPPATPPAAAPTPPAPTPAPGTPTPGPATPGPGTEPGASPSPLPGPRPEGIDRIVEEVVALRGLGTAEPLDARVVPAGELGARFAELAFAEYGEEELEFNGRLLTALRLLEPGDDLRAIIEDLYTEQIIGLYVVEEKILYIGGADPTLTAAQRVTAAHEVLHALQDRTFDLDAFMDLDDRESDALLARLALVEGDATLTQELWSLRFQSPAERQEAAEESRAHSPSALLAAPPYVRESLLFPYREGFEFVQALYARGGFEAVDAAYADPPASTRHVMRPETYLAGEGHTGTTVATTPGEGWEPASTYTLGEFDVDQWLGPLGQARHAVTRGWDGAETRHWRRDRDDAVALALRLSSPAAAEAACAGVPEWYATVAGGTATATGVYQGDRDWMALTCRTDEVLVGLAPDAATAARLAGRQDASAAGTRARHYTGARQP